MVTNLFHQGLISSLWDATAGQKQDCSSEIGTKFEHPWTIGSKSNGAQTKEQFVFTAAGLRKNRLFVDPGFVTDPSSLLAPGGIAMGPVQYTALVVPLVTPPYFDDVTGLYRDLGGDINVVSDENGVVVSPYDQKSLVLVSLGIVGKLFFDSHCGGHPNIGLFCHDNVIKTRQRSLCCDRLSSGWLLLAAGFGTSWTGPGSLSDERDTWGIPRCGLLSRRGSFLVDWIGRREETRPQKGHHGQRKERAELFPAIDMHTTVPIGS